MSSIDGFNFQTIVEHVRSAVSRCKHTCLNLRMCEKRASVLEMLLARYLFCILAMNLVQYAIIWSF